MSEKQVEINILASEAKLLKKFLGLMETEDTEKICKEYGIESEAYKIDDILYKLYQQLDYKLETKESRETKISSLIAEIERLTVLINIKGENTVFIKNHGHCKSLEVQVHLGGWAFFKNASLSQDISYEMDYKFFNYDECVAELENMVEKLNKLYKGEI